MNCGKVKGKPTRSQIDFIHEVLFGWPCDHLTPIDRYLSMSSVREVTLAILKSDRFRWDIRDKVPIWGSDKWVCTEFHGFKIWVNLLDGFVSFGVLHGGWEEKECELMRAILQPGDGMIDAGANIGVYTLHAAKAVGAGGKVYAFEPNVGFARMLKRTVAENGFSDIVDVYEEALGADDGFGVFNPSPCLENPGASFVTGIGDGARVAIRRIDSIPVDRHIRFIKMDAEGFEPNLVIGGVNTIAQHRPVILTEYFPRLIRKFGNSTAADFLRQWEEARYTVNIFATGEAITAEQAPRFENLNEPINLICRPM